MQRHIADLRSLAFTNVVIAIFAYASTIGLANSLGPSRFGEYSYILVVGMLLAQFVSFGSDEIAVRKHLTDGSNSITAIAAFKVLNFLIVSALLVIWALIFDDVYILTSLIVALQATSLSSIYELQKKNQIYANIYLIERIAYIGCIWTIIWTTGIVNFYVIFVPLLIFTLASIAFQIRQNFQAFSRIEFSKIFELWLDGIAIVSWSVSKYIYGGGSRIAIKTFAGNAALGLYSVAWQFVPLCTLFLTQVTKSWRLPISQAIFSKDIETFYRLLRHFFLFTTVPVIFFAALLTLFAPFILGGLLSKDYSDVEQLLPYISIYFLIINFDFLNSLLWIAIGQAKTLSWIQGSFSIACLAIMLVGRNSFDLSMYLSTIILCHGGSTLTGAIQLVPRLKLQFALASR